MEKLNISLSSTFLAKSKCKHCKGGPRYYYYIRKPYLFLDVKKHNKNVTKYGSEYFSAYYSDSSIYSTTKPSSISRINFMNYSIHAGYNPKLHKNVGIDKTGTYIEFLSCACSKTNWAFHEFLVKNRAEIINRKSKNKYPKEFTNF